jgi:anti-anti-sigma regulatory factor
MALAGVHIIILDLSEVSAIEAGGLSMILFLQRWAHAQGIQLKLFNAIHCVQDALERANSSPHFEISTARETMALLASAEARAATAT